MTERDDLLARVERYYTSALDRHGPTPKGVDWSSEESQRLRFDQLAKLWSDAPEDARSLLDYGCGYGALVSYLREHGLAFHYTGFDISPAMIARAAELHGGPHVVFTDEPATADYVVASGIFNVKLDTADAVWQSYVLDTLGRMNALANRGFAFNVLSRYSDPPRRRSDLYYADPMFFFDYCKTQFSNAVALLHDYPLYEFTILVRK